MVLKLERDGLAKIVRDPKGRIARAVMYLRRDDPKPTTLRDYKSRGYSFSHHLDDGHRPWAVRLLTGHVNHGDQGLEYHWAPDCVRPIFLRVPLGCLAPAM